MYEGLGPVNGAVLGGFNVAFSKNSSSLSQSVLEGEVAAENVAEERGDSIEERLAVDAAMKLAIGIIDVSGEVSGVMRGVEFEKCEGNSAKEELIFLKTSTENDAVSSALEKLCGRVSFILTEDKDGQNLYFLRMNKCNESCHSFILCCIEDGTKELWSGSASEIDSIELREIVKKLSKIDNKVGRRGDSIEGSGLKIWSQGKEEIVLAGGEIYLVDRKIKVSNKCGTIHGKEPDMVLNSLVKKIGADFDPHIPEAKEQELLDFGSIRDELVEVIKKIEVMTGMYSSIQKKVGSTLAKKLSDSLKEDIKKLRGEQTIDPDSLGRIAHKIRGRVGVIQSMI